MSKLDKQRRLSVPCDILEESKFPPNVEQIGICYDFKEKSIYLLPYCSLAPSDVLISIRKFDQQGRFFFPKEAISLLDAASDSLFLVYLHNNRICIRKI